VNTITKKVSKFGNIAVADYNFTYQSVVSGKSGVIEKLFILREEEGGCKYSFLECIKKNNQADIAKGKSIQCI